MHAGTAGKKQKLMHFIQKLKKGAIRDAAHYKGKGLSVLVHSHAENKRSHK